MATYYIPEGETARRTWTLREDDVIFNGTGFTLGIQIRDENNAPVTLTGTVQWNDAVNGQVSVDLDAADLPATGSPYDIRWTVTDPNGRVRKFPGGEREPDHWIVNF